MNCRKLERIVLLIDLACYFDNGIQGKYCNIIRTLKFSN